MKIYFAAGEYKITATNWGFDTFCLWYQKIIIYTAIVIKRCTLLILGNMLIVISDAHITLEFHIILLMRLPINVVFGFQ